MGEEEIKRDRSFVHPHTYDILILQQPLIRPASVKPGLRISESRTYRVSKDY